MRVILTRLSAFGDIIHCWPLVTALADAGHEVGWLVEEPFSPLVSGHPGVSRTICVATRRWRAHPCARETTGAILRCRREVREFRPSLALDPQGLVKSAVWAWQSGAPRRVGLSTALRRERLAGLFYTNAITPPASTTHVVDVNLALLESLTITPPYGAVPDGHFLLAGRAVGPTTIIDLLPASAPAPVALLPGAGGSSKMWPATSFVALARRCRARGLPVLVAWGPGEEALAREVAAGSSAMLAPPTGIVELAALLARCAAAVGGDTGPVHLAAALGVPTVAVFVATDPRRNGPRGNRVATVSSAASGARRGRARTASCGTVSVEAVDDALEALLAGGKG